MSGYLLASGAAAAVAAALAGGGAAALGLAPGLYLAKELALAGGAA